MKFFALKYCTKFLRPIKLILAKNYNFGSHLKIFHFWPNIVIWFTDHNGKRVTDKKMRFTGIKI